MTRTGSKRLRDFKRLIDADDLLLASDRLDDLMIYIGNADPEIIDPVIDRMLSSTDAEVRRAGGCMAAFAALQWGRPAPMERAFASDVEVRRGLAQVCAARVDRSADSELVRSTLLRLMHDEDEEVRKKVGSLAAHLRGDDLRPYAEFLASLIASPSYVHATPQLLITLQEAPDKVDDLVDLAAHRFLNIHGEDVADMRTGAAGGAHYISDLVSVGWRRLATEDASRRYSISFIACLSSGSTESIEQLMEPCATRSERAARRAPSRSPLRPRRTQPRPPPAQPSGPDKRISSSRASTITTR